MQLTYKSQGDGRMRGRVEGGGRREGGKGDGGRGDISPRGAKGVSYPRIKCARSIYLSHRWCLGSGVICLLYTCRTSGAWGWVGYVCHTPFAPLGLGF